jgi:3-hydroxyacyl-[acyl-carrier-protein] dehydratase
VRFLLVDAILEIDAGRRAIGIKNVTMSEDFLADHFPHRPIMPGMLIIESLVQLADWVIRDGTDFECLALARAFDRIKFRRLIRPGSQLRLDVEVISRNGAEANVRGRAYSQDALAVSADITVSLHPIGDYLDPDEARRQFALLRPEPGDQP